MKIRAILNTTEHRPWKIPTKSWKFYQEWNKAIFLHWQVELTELQKFVPKELKIDLFEGKPWVSVVAFSMERIKPKNLPSFPPLSNFDEINIRTYVKSDNKSGVYFLSIEGGKKLSCIFSKGISELPYRFSKIKRTENKYEAINSEFNDTLNIEFTIGKELTKKTKLDKWLTERYVLYQDTVNSINEFEIHHLEWPFKEIELKKVGLNYQRFNNLINNEPRIVQYSTGVKVIAWGKIKKARTEYNTGHYEKP